MRKTPHADSYTGEYYGCVTEAARRRYRDGLYYLQPRSGELILDVGCGRGEMVAECRNLGANAIGIDYSQAAVEISKETLREGVVIRASATHLPFVGETFDKVLSLDVLEHLDEEDTLKCVTEIRRVLKVNGMLIIHTANKWQAFREGVLWLPNLIYNLLFPQTKFDPRLKQYLEAGHVGIPSPLSLQSLLRANNFSVKIRFDTLNRNETAFWKFIILFIIYKVMFFTGTLWAIAYKHKAAGIY